MNEQIWTTFKMVAELGTISEAARQLNLSQSAVSQQIQQLEAAYDSMLFLRTHHGVQLTAAGEILYRYINTILKTVEDSRHALDDLKSHQPTTLNIGASLTIAEYILPRVLAHDLQFLSTTNISVTMANSRTVFERVRQGEIHVGLIEAHLSDPQLVVRPFLDDQPCAVVSRTHPWVERQEVTVKEFVAQPLILREPGSGTRQTFEEALTQADIDLQTLQVRLVLATTQAIKSMVISGIGITVLSPFTILPPEREVLHTLRIQGLNLYRNFYVVHRRDLNLRLAHYFVQALLQSPTLAPYQ